MWDFIRRNSRAARQLQDDLDAQIASVRLGAKRFVELMDRYGRQLVLDATQQLMDYTERVLRQRIAAIPDGEYRDVYKRQRDWHGGGGTIGRSMARVGVDVGGTNTDLVLEADHGVFVHKVASTPHDQSEGVLKGLHELCKISNVRPDDVSLIVHGTTIATNITIEHNGAEVGMLTSHNFRDILHIGRHKRPYNFSLHFEVPWQQRPLVKRRNRIAVTERILPPNGEIGIPLDEKEIVEATRLFKRRGIKSVVIGFLFSFLNDAHERRAAEIVRAEMPDAYICTSSEVANVIREYERFSTAAMNAFVGPKTSLYLNNLQTKLTDSGFRANLRVIQSNGGIATVETCSQKAVGILMSGPAGGVIGGRAEGMLCGRSNLITVDIGGTSADISTIPDGRIKIMNARDSYVNGHPILVPMIDLRCV